MEVDERCVGIAGGGGNSMNKWLKLQNIGGLSVIRSEGSLLGRSS